MFRTTEKDKVRKTAWCGKGEGPRGLNRYREKLLGEEKLEKSLDLRSRFQLGGAKRGETRKGR